jgi:hypothetical protein
MRAATSVALGLCVVGAAACNDESPVSPDRLAVVRVESVAPRAPLASVCVGDTCNGFNSADEVRAAELSVELDEVVFVEVLLVGDEEGFGTGGPIGPGDCMFVRLSPDELTVDTGCTTD